MLRAPFEAPKQEAQFHRKRNKVSFKHPAYQDQLGGNTLFSLWAWDSPEGGIHHATALLACTIVACNATNGFLSKDQAGLERVSQEDDSLLSPSVYYFHVPSPTPPSIAAQSEGIQPPPGPYKYPVCVNFDHWRYPHDTDMFPTWLQRWVTPADSEVQQPFTGTPAASTATAAVLARDRTCILTQEGDSLDRAHVCPRSTQEWFHKNDMQRYNDRQDLSGDLVTDDLANALAMSCSRHRAFDAGHFVFVFKCGEWVAHFMEMTAHYASQHHNRPVKLPQNLAPQFLLARFAWTLFPRIKNFLEAGVPRLVRVQGKNLVTGEYKEEDKLLGREDINKILQAGRGRSASPRKRSAPDPEQGDAEGNDHRQRNDRHSGVDGIGYDGNFAKESQGPDSPVIDSVHSAPAAKSQVLPLCQDPQHSPLKRAPKRSRWTNDEEEDDEQRRISALRADALRGSRPSNPDLICCDYTAAENANAMGVYGREEFGGGHLCMKCLGVEVRDDEG